MPIRNIEIRKEYQQKYQQKYYITHKAEIAEFQRKYRANHKARYKELKIEYRQILKAEVLIHYGLGQLRCMHCGEKRAACLSIDHINGGGAKHRRKIGVKTSRRFYQWLRTNRYPGGYQTLCMNCQFVKRVENKEWTAPQSTNPWP